ncbi:ergothioneine biosynthesis protein EgtB [Caenimonas koreensis DSM 17982]|uniref:Ergothioneine biosynthesis protein EgtB n=1 Tax=Caenimonas koreensis DSM 17982 TaxID=1121255 RepID=A0A844AQJ8_9BURK|nr:ergothioneine biosynthesis protein EgtB [Caenimonas koreensis]MRD46550.1 ergothioneine biosynthesis protein EgtB [Caenimonas koreensis DSM 17982]
MPALPSTATIQHLDLPGRHGLLQRFAAVRAHSLAITSGLTPEDQCVQSMPDASPTKWHLAHTSWFFEAVVLSQHAAGYRAFDQRFFHLFNSYYEALGPRHPRAQRGLLTRPAHDEVLAYRMHVDAAMQALIETASHDTWLAAQPLVELGLHHEQQHQELILTDILHAFSCNPLLPACEPAGVPALRLAATASDPKWLAMPGGIVDMGHTGDGFAFDNETPRHQTLLAPYQIADRLVTCGDYAQFIADGGYERASFWLSDGWAAVQAAGWKAPAYWIAPGDARAPASHWQVFGLQGVRPLDPSAPVSQLSFYEAAAYAEWAGARLPTEAEWEAAFTAPGITQMTGHVWQWTRSSYDPYPGFRPLAGAVGEYNGKFMVGQIVLRGSSVATPAGHARPTYRNFFPPAARWQFSGLRLAKDATC